MNKLFNRSKDAPQRTVMVVEDDAPIAEVMSELLKDEGYTAHMALSAEQALTMLDEIPLPDLFIVDFMLGDMNGQQFIEHLRNRVGRSKMSPVLMLTASTEGEAMANASQVNDYLPKPFKNQVLLEHVARLLGDVQK